MTTIKINETELKTELNSNSTIGDIIDLITSKDYHAASVIALRIDGKRVNHAEQKMLASTIGQYQEIEFFVQSKIELIREVIDSSNRYVDYIINKIKQLVKKYNKNKVEEANYEFAQIVEILSLFIQLMSNTNSSLKDLLSEHTIKGKEEQFLELHLLGILRALIPARKKNDIIMLSDLLEHELIDNLSEWRDKIIPKLRRFYSKIREDEHEKCFNRFKTVDY